MDEQRIPPRPLYSKIAARILNPLNSVFDWCYHSEYNPFYRSGTLAIGLLFVLLATGFYLVFFYSVSDPYTSVFNIQQQVWLGRWIRALHRYATDAAIIAVFFHVLQLLAQGKTWGPRTLAWVSGVVLLIGLCISAWTGYVMVWDKHAQLVATGGLKLLSVFPIFSTDVARAFSGQDALPASFFFLNLFLHVAIPLGMILGMWVHTARLARTVWFPTRSVFWGTLGALFILSLMIPAPLPEKADLLAVLGPVPSDWWYGFWIPLLETSSPSLVLSGLGVLFALGITLPWWWRPRRKQQPPISQVDVDDCNGCTQCARDCPYEAITMVPHPNGKHLLAEVSPIHCVSCGICAASCAEFAVGPPGRTPRDQLQLVDSLFEDPEQNSSSSVVVVGCKHNESIPQFLSDHAAKTQDVSYIDLNCCGTLHSNSLETLLSSCGGVILVGCAARNCMNRDGLNLLLGRFYEKRVPFLDRSVDRRRIVVASHSEREKSEIINKIGTLQEYVSAHPKQVTNRGDWRSRLAWYSKRTIASTFLLGILALLNQLPMGKEVQHASLRIMGRLPGQIQLDCRPLSEKERRTLPRHMQKEEVCEQKAVKYRVQLRIDQKEVFKKVIKPRSLRGELPVFLYEEVALEPKQHHVSINVETTDAPAGYEIRRGIEKVVDFSAGKIELISID